MKVKPLSLSQPPPRLRMERPLPPSRRRAEVLPFPLDPARLVRETRALIAGSNLEAVRSHGLDLKRLLDLLS
ncbi:MAG: hypothetical protein HY900_03450 [Deltaproteobacteria bacterium]|nr:hypothetical protein [Deltaproteobacteria bacterium]